MMPDGEAAPWILLAILLPLAAAVLAVPLGRHARLLTWALLPAMLAVALLLARQVLRDGVVTYALGGWQPPLGIALRADGLSAAMVVATALVVAAATLHGGPGPQAATGREELFRPLLLAAWSALNAVFLGGDLFNLYVALEMLTLAAVPMVSLGGKAATIAAALRYLLFALLGSVLYLLGCALLYGAYGTLDIALLAARVEPGVVGWMAAALMTAGLLAKTALVPLHLWLPPAHAGAPPAASAVLSALVVKASFYLVVRLWFDTLPVLITEAAAQGLAVLGGAAILLGSAMALRQRRLKLLIAYSTVAQLGYLFLMFPLVGGTTEAQPWVAGAWAGGALHAVSHAFAKAAMFLAAGLVLESAGHDRIASLGGMARALPMAVFAFGLAGLSLMGLPPSGGFIAKWLLLTAAMASGQWWWALVMLAGGLLAAGYVFRVIGAMLGPAAEDAPPPRPLGYARQSVPLLLALASAVLGIAPLPAFTLLLTGRPFAAEAGFTAAGAGLE
jgi:formate hydrogenlyase subunit 3/multisubunit Na+/H+ antiporter MnhD subunit